MRGFSRTDGGAGARVATDPRPTEELQIGGTMPNSPIAKRL
jgi:hypothetical protein